MSRMTRHESRWVVLLVALMCTSAYAADEAKPKLLDVTKIWDKAPHNAFTDLVRFKGRWWCVFREGKEHVSGDGALRIITSADAKEWESAALIEMKGVDLRDAKLSEMPDGKLMLCGAARYPAADGGLGTYRTMVWVSPDGKDWGDGRKVLADHLWLWRVTWHKGVAYGIAYATAGKPAVHLYSTKDGKEFERVKEDVFSDGEPNEHGMVFLPDDTAVVLLRRDGKEGSGQVGTARPPYREWAWKDLGVKIGGPGLIRLSDGRLVGAVRLYDKKVRTSLCWVDVEKGKVEECLELPSGGDCSYAGMVQHEGVLYVSYYSSHEGKTSVYLARVEVR